MNFSKIILMTVWALWLTTFALGDDVIPDECGYFTSAVSTRTECTSTSGGSIEFTGEANIYDNPSTTLYTCEVITPQWVLDNTQTCESGDCEQEPGNTKSLSIDYTNTPSSASTSATPSSSSTDETIDGDKTLNDYEYNDINFNNAGKGKTLTFEQSNSMRSSAKTLKVNTITSAWQILFKNNVDIKIGSITGATYGSPINIKTNSGTNINKISVDSMRYKENTTINLEAKDSIDIKTFEVGRSDSNVTLKAKEVTLDTLTVSNSGSGEAEITIIADKVNIGTLDMGQGAKVTILPYTSGNTVELKSNEIKASSNSELILSSGDYHTGIFNVPGTSNASSLRAKDSDQVVNFYINGDFKPGNNPGINSAGNNGDFGTLPAKNFRMFINGDLNTGGGGTTFNATIYTEDDATLGNPTYIKGALSANNKIEIGEGSKIYYSGDSADEAYLSCPLAGHDDICYETPITAGFDFGPVGFFTSVKTPIKNISNTNITNTTVIKSFDGLDMSMMSKIKLNDIKKTLAKDGDEAEVNQGLQASFGIFNAGGIFNKGIVYRIDNFDVNQSHTIYDYSMFSFDMSKIKLNTIYTKNGKRYYSEIHPCGSGSTPYISGPFDAWDTFRDNLSEPPSDRNISTKIVNKTFKISLASLDRTNTHYEPKNGTIKISIYQKDTTNSISNTVNFNAATAHAPISSDIMITEASKDAVVGFKLCATYKDDGGEMKYILYPDSSCTDTTIYSCDTHTDTTPSWHICYSTDNFAVRPEKFTITTVPLITAAKGQLYTVEATKSGGDASNKYTVSDSNYTLNVLNTKYMPDDSINSSLHGEANVTSYSFVDGNSSDVNISYNDIGKVEINLQDRHWADVDSDDTPTTCNNNGNLSTSNGRYICGDTNATFIPSFFTLENVELYNDDNSTFTYFSNDLNMSAKIDLNITARNDLNATTQNFDSASWENPISVNFNVTSTPTTANKNEISTTRIGFTNGSAHIIYNETNSSKNLAFNFVRTVNNPLNPVKVNGSQVSISASSVYGSITVTQENTQNATSDATFIYGRTHAPRQRYENNSGTVFIYYEAYCYGTDSNSTSCNKTLLPSSAKQTDDIRWYVNSDHNVTVDGNATNITEKGDSVVTSTALNNSTPSSATLTYNESYGYPYKTTMQNDASSWLIYNPDSSSATKNEFSVEFNKIGNGWSGKHETNTTTKSSGTATTNRRSMW